MRAQALWLSILLSAVPFAACAQSGGGEVPVEDRNAFIERCVAETIAEWPGAADQAGTICGSKWELIDATAPLADAVLALTPSPGEALDPPAARGRLEGVDWVDTPDARSFAIGRLGALDVNVAREPEPTVTFAWIAEGEPIPFDLLEALRVRGIQPEMIGCYAFGAGEGGSAYRVDLASRQPIALTINFREAAMATQWASYVVTVAYGGSIPTLTDLRSDGGDWAASCR
jgi:hypothetical protein